MRTAAITLVIFLASSTQATKLVRDLPAKPMASYADIDIANVKSSMEQEDFQREVEQAKIDSAKF